MSPNRGQPVGIQIDVSKAVGKLRAVQVLLDVETVLRGIGMKQLYWIGKNLQEAGTVPGGQPWQVMAPITLKRRPLRKSKHHFSSPYQTLLQQSFVVDDVNPTKASVSVGTNARYARDHQEGVRSRNLPARKLLPEPNVAQQLAAEFLNAVIAKVRAEGAK